MNNRRNIHFLFVMLIIIAMTFAMFTGCLEETDAGPPLTTILHPANGDIVTGVVPIIVTASDEKVVESVQLFIDGVQVVEETGDLATYQWDTTPIADNKEHHISAYAIDDNGNIGPSAVTTVTLFFISAADTLPQLVTVQHPINGQTVSGNVNVAIGVDRDIKNPIDSVAIFIDGIQVNTITELPYIHTWNTDNLVNGSQHTVFAIAYDFFGYNINSSVTTVSIVSDVPGNIPPPIVTIENPIDNQTVSGPVNIVAHVEGDEYNTIDSVLFVVDGMRASTTTEYPYIHEWDVSNFDNGSQHSIFAVAYDMIGFNPSSNFITVTALSNIIPDVDTPVVTMVFPDPAAQNIFSVSELGSIIVVADASDDFGVDSVAFYIDGIYKTTETTPLYQYDWDLTQYSTGVDHTIYVRAWDPSGNVGAAFMAVRLEP